MPTVVKPKQIPASYGEHYQERMLSYYRRSKVPSKSNTEYLRVVLAHELVNTYALPRLSPKPPSEITFVDIGCSVGLFAIEFAKQGYNSFGVDFDPAALQIAVQLNAEEGADARFLQMDVADWSLDIPIDVALAFDIFEHLYDDELGAMLYGLKRKLSERGCLVFHTLPLQYDYLFFDESKGMLRFPWLLCPFKDMSVRHFDRMVKVYGLCLDVIRLCTRKRTERERIKTKGHCNPLTPERLEDILTRAGYEIIFIRSGFLGEAQLPPSHREYFYKQPITHRSLFGVAAPEQVR